MKSNRSGPVKDEDANVVTVVDEPTSVDDQFAQFFDQYEGGTTIAELNRITPTSYKGVSIKGFLGQIDPTFTLQDIKDRWGGGQFRLNLKDLGNHGKFIQAVTIHIPEPPKVDPALFGGSSEQPAAPQSDKVQVPTVNVAGVDIPLDDEMRYLTRVMVVQRAVDQMFPPRADPNLELVRLLIEARTNPPKDDFLERLGAFRQAFPDAFGGRPGGDTWPSVVREVVPEITQLFGGQRGGAPARLPASKPASIPALPPGEKREPSTQTEPQENEAAMSNTEYANAVLSHVVQGFRLQPPKEPDRLVNVLDQVLRLKSKEERARLNNFKWVLFDLAENQLADDFLADETGETRKAFEAYFNQVFETYVDPEREVMLL